MNPPIYRIMLRNTGNYAEFIDKNQWLTYRDVKLYERDKKVYTELGTEVKSARVQPWMS